MIHQFKHKNKKKRGKQFENSSFVKKSVNLK